MDPGAKAVAAMTAGLVAAMGEVTSVPEVIQGGALAVVVLMVVLGHRSAAADREQRAKDAEAERDHAEKLHKINVEAIQRAYENHQHKKD